MGTCSRASPPCPAPYGSAVGASGVMNDSNRQLVKTWKVRTTVKGCVLTLNGQEFELGASAQAVAFDIERAANGLNAPESERAVERD